LEALRCIAKADRSLLDSTLQDGCGLAYVAAEEGWLCILTELLSRGCDILLADDDGWTPAHVAAANGRCDCVQFFTEYIIPSAAKGLEEICNPEDHDGLTPIFRAAFAGHDDVVQILVSAGIDPAEKRDHIWGGMERSGWSAFHVAVDGGSVDVVQYLISQDCIDVDEHNDDGQSPVFIAYVWHRRYADAPLMPPPSPLDAGTASWTFCESS
jgi:ankyrin repeat protein